VRELSRRTGGSPHAAWRAPTGLYHRVMRSLARIALLVSLGVVALACSSSGGGGGGAGSASLTGTWCSSSSTFAGFTFSGSNGCSFDVEMGATTLCGSQCTYTLSGDRLTMTTMSPADGGAGTTSQTCAYKLTFSNGGGTLEIATDGGQAGCPSYDVTVERSGAGSSCSFGCG